MACANNFYMRDKHYSNIKYKIPCRYCINCRVDRIKEWKMRTEYEFKKLITGTFLTLTYDECNLLNSCIVKGNDGNYRATLKYKHTKRFLENLREDIKTHNYNNVLANPKFKYIGVGEYGENGKILNRPHWHILLLGLDWRYCETLYKKHWKYGLLEADPIKKGGISYVLKYMDKQIKGKKEIWENYRRYGLEPPKQFNSKALGAELYLENRENANKNGGTIKSGLKNIPVPNYYRKKYGIKINENKNTERQIENLKNYNKNYKNPNKEIKEIEYMRAKEEIEREITRQSKIRESNLLEKAQKSGEKIYIQRS